MAEWRQKLRGTTLELDQVVGLEGLLAYDTERKELRVYDGVLMGGYKVPNAATIDSLYKLPDRLTPIGKVLEAISANTATEAGFYATRDTTTDLPENTWGSLLVLNASGTTRRHQVWTKYDNSAKYRRASDSAGSFVGQPWLREVDLTFLTTNASAKAYDADRLDGQDSTYYTAIAARLGYTPVNKAGDTMTGTLNVTALNASAAVDLNAGLNVDGATTMDALTASGAATLQSTLAVTGTATFSGTAVLNGAADLNSTLNVQGAATLQSTLLVQGNTLTIEGTSPSVYLKDTVGADDFWLYVNSDRFYVLTDRADDNNFETPHPLELINASSEGLLYGAVIYTTANDGAGSGMDSDLLDGQHGSYYTAITARLGYTPVNKAGDTMTGNLTIQSSAPIIYLKDTTAGSYDTRFRFDANNIYFDSSSDGVAYSEFLRFEADTKAGFMQNTLTVTAASGEALRATASAANGDPYISFYQSTTRRGYIQYNDGAAADAGMRMLNEAATGGVLEFILSNNGGVGGFTMAVNGSNYTAIHTGNIDVYDLAKYYAGSDVNYTAYPLGTPLLVDDIIIDRNASATLRLSGTALFTTVGTGTVVSGTYRAKGVYTNGNGTTLMQRTG